MFGEFRLSKPVGWVLGFSLVIILTLRFYIAKDGFSYDYVFYIEFFKAAKSASFSEFLAASSETFPYTKWEAGARFEFGFSFLVYLLTRILSASATYAAIAFLSLSLKLYIFSKAKAHILYVFPLFIYAGVLLEGNALRAGVATSLLMCSAWLFYRGKLKGPFIIMMIASSIHISSLLFFLGFIVVYFLHILRLYYTGMLLAFAVTTIAIVNVHPILVLMGGKLGEYAAQTLAGMYTGASGLNAQSLMALSFFLMIQYCSTKDARIVRTGNARFAWLYFSILSICSFVLIAFSGKFSIFGDRIWHMVYFALVVYVSLLWQSANRFIRFGKLSIARLYLFLGLGFVYYFLALSVLIRYPQNNLASFFLEWIYYAPESIK